MKKQKNQNIINCIAHKEDDVYYFLLKRKKKKEELSVFISKH